jgi:hypothetical protein
MAWPANGETSSWPSYQPEALGMAKANYVVALNNMKHI